MAAKPLKLTTKVSKELEGDFQFPGFIYNNVLDILLGIADQSIDGDGDLPEAEQGAGLTGADLKEFLAFAAEPENTWVRGKGSPAMFIETKFASFIERGLSRANISVVQAGLVRAYAREISDDRHPERVVKGLITRPLTRPPDAPEPLSRRPVAFLTEEQLAVRRARGKEYSRQHRLRKLANG